MDTKTRILIIDDEDIVLKSCLRILKKEEYEIDTAGCAVVRGEPDRVTCQVGTLAVGGSYTWLDESPAFDFSFTGLPVTCASRAAWSDLRRPSCT